MAPLHKTCEFDILQFIFINQFIKTRKSLMLDSDWLNNGICPATLIFLSFAVQSLLRDCVCNVCEISFTNINLWSTPLLILFYSMYPTRQISIVLCTPTRQISYVLRAPQVWQNKAIYCAVLFSVPYKVAFTNSHLKPIDSFGMWWQSNEIIFLHWIIIS